MSMLLRLFLLLSMLLPLAGHRASPMREEALVHRNLIGQAAVRLGHASRSTVLSWLRRHPGVASAMLGVDDRTVDVRFSDGTEGAVLPRISVTSRLALPPVRVGRPHVQVA